MYQKMVQLNKISIPESKKKLNFSIKNKNSPEHQVYFSKKNKKSREPTSPEKPSGIPELKAIASHRSWHGNRPPRRNVQRQTGLVLLCFSRGLFDMSQDIISAWPQRQETIRNRFQKKRLNFRLRIDTHLFLIHFSCFGSAFWSI